MKVLLKNIKENDVFSFRPKDYGEFANWCRENLFIAMRDDEGKLWFVDTYWGIRRWDNKKYTFSEINKLGKLEYYCNLDEIEKVGENEWEYYEKADKFFLSDQHACVPSCRYYFVKKGAKRSKAIMQELLEQAISNAKHEVERRVSEVERLVEKKAELEKGNLDIYI